VVSATDPYGRILVFLERYPIIIIIIIYLNCKCFYLPGSSGKTLRHNTQIHILHKITHHAQTKRRKQGYTNNKGHITHNEVTNLNPVA
jgi:hypothetical protein